MKVERVGYRGAGCPNTGRALVSEDRTAGGGFRPSSLQSPEDSA